MISVVEKQPVRKRSLFLRLFASIMAITLVILIVQVVVVTIMFVNQGNDFKDDVFTTYAQRLQEALDSGTRDGVVWGLRSVEPILKQAADDRISGLILYDGEGNTVLTFGKTPGGVILPPIDFNREPPPSSGTDPAFQPLVESPWFTKPTISKLYVHTGGAAVETGVVMPRYPEPVRKQDVVGTVTLYSDATRTEVFGSVDVLAFSPLTYWITAMVLKRMILAFSITIPIALVIALIGARLVARSVSRHARLVADALESVANGNHTQQVPDSSLRELAQISDSVDRLGEQLESHERMRQQWLRSIAHDLNTPVTALKISIEGALEGILPLDQALLERLKKENDELERRVISVMTLSAMEAPDFIPKMEPIDVLEFVDEVVNSSLSKNKITLDIEMERIIGDRRLLLLVCREVLKNASKYSPEGSSVTWRIINGIGPYTVCMEVVNEGQIPLQMLEHVFEPWFRVDASRSQGGAGMGLSIIRQVMELHHGIASMTQDENHVTMTLQW